MSEIIVNGLIKRKEEITIEKRRMQLQLKAMDADIAHITATIRIFSPEYSAPKKERIARGGISRKLFDILRESSEPMTCREIAVKMVGEDSEDLRVTAKRIGVTLCNQQKNGKVKSGVGDGNAKLWELI